MLVVVVVGLNLLLMLLLLMRVSMVTNTAQNPPAIIHNIHPCIPPDRAHLGAIQIMSSTSATMDQVTMK